MKQLSALLVVFGIVVLLALTGCHMTSESGEHGGRDESRERGGEGSGEHGSGEESERSGRRVRRPVRPERNLRPRPRRSSPHPVV